MILNLTKSEVEEACEYWLRANGYANEHKRSTAENTPVAIDTRYRINCAYGRDGVKCTIFKDCDDE